MVRLLLPPHSFRPLPRETWLTLSLALGGACASRRTPPFRRFVFPASKEAAPYRRCYTAFLGPCIISIAPSLYSHAQLDPNVFAARLLGRRHDERTRMRLSHSQTRNSRCELCCLAILV